MFFKKKTPKSGSARLEQEMASIADQAAANAKSLRSGQTLSPISHADTESLFSEKNATGETVYNHYHFTDDMTQLDPEAQIHLMQLFGQVLAFNEMLEHAGVERRLDWIVANASFFERFFARANFSTELLTHNGANDVDVKLNAILGDDKARFDQMLPAMFEPDSIVSLMPRSTIPLMVAMGKPYEDGQQFINGVYFSAQTAPAVMNWLASLQAQAKPPQDNNPAHA